MNVAARSWYSLIVGLATVTLLSANGLAQPAAKPKEPLTISVIDVAGDLQVSQPAIENFRKDHPDLVSVSSSRRRRRRNSPAS